MLNLGIKPSGLGSRLNAFVCVYRERLNEGALRIERSIQASELHLPAVRPIYNVRQVPAMVRNRRPVSMIELARLTAGNIGYAEQTRAGRATLQFFASRIEEPALISPREISATIRYDCDAGVPGGEVRPCRAGSA